MEVWILLGGLAVVVALATWRLGQLNTRHLSDTQAAALTRQLEEAVFEYAAGPEVSVPVRASYWRDIGGSRTAVEVSRWANGRGRITTPGWDLFSILAGQPPRFVALTEKSFKQMTTPAPTPMWVSNGPVTVNGGQIVLGNVTVELSQLDVLADSLESDSVKWAPKDGEHLREQATLLRRAVATGDTRTAGRVLGWVRDRLDEATGNAMGSGLFLLTQAAFRALFT